jgi:predicted  nucleic acid-binding Zn-ribbon protein
LLIPSLQRVYPTPLHKLGSASWHKKSAKHVLAIDKEVKDLEKQIVKLSDSLQEQQAKIQDDEKALTNTRAACQRAREMYDEAWKAHMKAKNHQALAVSDLKSQISEGG